MTKLPLGGTGANPADRGKKGTKINILTDGKGNTIFSNSRWSQSREKACKKDLRCYNPHSAHVHKNAINYLNIAIVEKLTHPLMDNFGQIGK